MFYHMEQDLNVSSRDKKSCPDDWSWGGSSDPLAVVFVIDTHLSLDPWRDGDVEMLWFFLVGSIFFLGALRRYRADRRAERKVSWYRRPDLLLCLIGLVSGSVFAVSLVQKWYVFVFIKGIGSTHAPVFNKSLLLALGIALFTVYFCWTALLTVLIYQAIKRNTQRKKASP
jgi:hypothetical protein